MKPKSPRQKQGTFLYQDLLEQFNPKVNLVQKNGQANTVSSFLSHGLDFRHTREKAYRIGYAWSDDLSTWHRDDPQASIDVSTSGWDSEMIEYPDTAKINGKQIMFLLWQSLWQRRLWLCRTGNIRSTCTRIPQFWSSLYEKSPLADGSYSYI